MRGNFSDFGIQVRFRTEISVFFPRHTVTFQRVRDDSGVGAQRLEGDVSPIMFGLV